MRFVSLAFLGCAALLSALTSVSAMPLFNSPLLRPAPLSAIVSVPQATPPAALPIRSIGLLWSWQHPALWGAATDPSLRLTDWDHVLDIASLGGFDVPLRADPGERVNILLAASAIDNSSVAPGQTFSFNAAVGERTPERGYQDGLMFDKGQVVYGTGGGICLVATGLYNAALKAGLEIDERHPHSGLVSYAPPGCDAGIVFGSEDLRFRNTTASSIVLRAVPEDDHVEVRIFGRPSPLGQRVVVKSDILRTIPAPVITKPDLTLLPGETVIDQKPHNGYDVVVERFWTQNKRVVRREVVVRETRAPRPEIVRVGPLPPNIPPLLGAGSDLDD